MQCPKCKKEAFSDKECDYCGVVFNKYQEEHLKTLAANEIQSNGSNIKKPAKPTSILFKIVIVVGLILAYVFLRVRFYVFCDLMHFNRQDANAAVLVFFTMFYIIGAVVVKWRQNKR